MAPVKRFTWTAERLAELSDIALSTVSKNVARAGDAETIQLCATETTKRAELKKKPPRPKSIRASTNGKCVIGFHFVCPTEKEVTTSPDGTVRTGTWVVDESHAKKAVEIGAYVALHVEKAQPSYLQGIVKGWEKSARKHQYADDQIVKTEYGIDFFLERTNQPYTWVGDGSGEKGYAWGDC